MQASPPSTTKLLHQGEIRWNQTSCPACHHSILSIIHLVSCTKHNYPELIARDSGLIPWTWVQQWQIVVSGKKSPWLSSLLRWSNDNDDNQAHAMSSNLLIHVALRWLSQSCRLFLLDKEMKNSLYIIFITEGKCFYNVPKYRMLRHRYR